jgi:hypothetical protein
MTRSDQVRDYVWKTYIAPARALSQSPVPITVVAGDVAKASKLSNRLPLVCGALGALKFQRAHSIRLVKRSGPGQGATANVCIRCVTPRTPKTVLLFS